jgi:hypothetical protein
MNFQDEIKLKKIERINSIYFQFIQKQSNIIEKSESNISQNSTIYSEDSFVFQKKGKEIKEKILGEINTLEEEKKSLLKNMSKLVEDIGKSPCCSMDDWKSNEWRRKIDMMPVKYGYKEMYPNSGSNDDIVKMMQSYNIMAIKYIDVCVDIIKLNTIMANIDDNKVFNLNSNLASKLGF